MYKKINVNLIHDWAISSVVVLKACCQRFSCFSRDFSLLDKEEDGGGEGCGGKVICYHTWARLELNSKIFMCCTKWLADTKMVKKTEAAVKVMR
jgi:hypothetical protein